MPRLLIPDTSGQYLTLFKRNPKEFLCRVSTVDESWFHWYTPENNEQSKQWTSPGERIPKKAKTIQSAGKVLAMDFWDSQGPIHIEKDKMITELYYKELLGELKKVVRRAET